MTQEETVNHFSVTDKGNGRLELNVNGSLLAIATLLASAMYDDQDIERMFLIALAMVEAKKADPTPDISLN